MNFKVNNNFKLNNIKSYNNISQNKIIYDLNENYKNLNNSQNTSVQLEATNKNNPSSLLNYSIPEILQRVYEKIINKNTLSSTNYELAMSNLRKASSNETSKALSVPLNSILNDKVIDKNVLTLLASVDLKQINSNFEFVINNDDDDTAFYSGLFNIIAININDLNKAHTVLHEMGHAYYHNLVGNKNQYLQITPTIEMQNIIQNAQNNIKNNPEKLDYMMEKAQTIYDSKTEEARKWYETIKDEENKRISDVVNFLDLFGLESLLSSDLSEAGVDSSEINNILSDKQQLISILQQENQTNKIYEYQDYLMRNTDDGLYATGTFTIINSIMQKKIITIGNKEYDCHYCHVDSYWLDDNENISLVSYSKSYDELMADYFAYNALDQQELMTDMRELAGDEIIDSLSNEYANMVEISKTIN